jgi:tRNA-Thr(GGU) m(6)t(6)A37 methyltransferase TsaA
MEYDDRAIEKHVFTVTPIGWVRGGRGDVRDDDWGDVRARIELVDGVPASALDGLEDFSHAEVIFVFDRVDEEKVERGTRHPRGNPAWPRVGILAQRAKDRPNRLGSTIVEIAGRVGRTLEVIGLDAVDGTPVLDVKPVMAEFLPRTAVRQPPWSRELMREYWHGSVAVEIGPYEARPVELLPSDARFPAVATALARRIRDEAPDLVVEHVGSTAVPGCRGKGVIDLCVLYAAGGLAGARARLDAIGFQRQGGRDPFPESRPMRVATAVFEGRSYRVHAHVLERDGSDHAELVAFRDRLRADDATRTAYEREKAAILARGVLDDVDYAEKKGHFVRRVLAGTI